MAQTKLTTKSTRVPEITDLPGFEVIAEKLDKLVPDAYQPAQMVCRLEDTCSAKTSRDAISMALLAGEVTRRTRLLSRTYSGCSRWR